jgi:glutamyl-tRNA reductase
VELAQQIFGDLEGRKIMILGAGETSEKTAWSFQSRGARQLIVSNRSFEKAAALAAAIGGRAIGFADWEKEFRDLDVLVSSTSAPHAIVTRPKLEPVLRTRRDRFMSWMGFTSMTWIRFRPSRDERSRLESGKPRCATD